jgi:hypothetical protein
VHHALAVQMRESREGAPNGGSLSANSRKSLVLATVKLRGLLSARDEVLLLRASTMRCLIRSSAGQP